MSIFLDCKYMGWTYEEYMRQPQSFLEVVHLFRVKETEEQIRRQRYADKQ